MNGRIAGVTAWAFCHSTEDDSRVISALRTVLGEEADIEERPAESHFGQKMNIIYARRKGREALARTVGRLADSDFRSLMATVEDRTDDGGTLHFRLDKQAAYGGSLALSSGLEWKLRKERDSIDVEVRVITYPGGKGNAVKFIAGLLEEVSREKQG